MSLHSLPVSLLAMTTNHIFCQRLFRVRCLHCRTVYTQVFGEEVERRDGPPSCRGQVMMIMSPPWWCWWPLLPLPLPPSPHRHLPTLLGWSKQGQTVPTWIRAGISPACLFWFVLFFQSAYFLPTFQNLASDIFPRWVKGFPLFPVR